MLKPPCKDCPDRNEDCHSVCVKYKEFRRLKDAENAARDIRMKQKTDLREFEKGRAKAKERGERIRREKKKRGEHK